MRVALEALDVGVPDDVLAALEREVSKRTSSSVFAGVRDLRLRLRRAKGALLCVAAVGFTSGDLVTSTATSESPLDAVVGALDGLPERIDRAKRSEERENIAPPSSAHGAVREQLRRLFG